MTKQDIHAVAEGFQHPLKWPDGKVNFGKLYTNKIAKFLFLLKFIHINHECEVDPIQKTARFDCHRGK